MGIWARSGSVRGGEEVHVGRVRRDTERRTRSRSGLGDQNASLTAVAHARDSLAAPMHLELVEDVVHVVLHRARPDAEARGDLLVAEALIDEHEDLALASGKREIDRRRGRRERGNTPE